MWGPFSLRRPGSESARSTEPQRAPESGSPAPLGPIDFGRIEGKFVEDKFGWTMQLSEEHLPRAQVLNDITPGTGLGGWLGAHPTFTTATVATLGTLTLLPGAQAAPLAQARQTPARAVDQGIVYVGMNADSKLEVQNLQRAVGAKGVTYIHDTGKADVVKIGSTELDLATPEGRDQLAAKLGLEGDRAKALSEVLEGAYTNSRDELGQLAQVFAQAEAGNRTIERLVFSGHSMGSSIWGDDNGTLPWETVGQLTAIFPRAAGQVQDLLIAGCYSGGEWTMDTYRALFPNLKTIWAYDGSAPGAVSGAVPHILRWEAGTRGPSSDRLTRDTAANTRKGENVAVWTATKGYSNGHEPEALDVPLEAYTRTKPSVDEARSGALVIENPQAGPLRDHYNHIQHLLSRRDIDPAQRADLKGERDFVIRLLFYKNVSGMFQVTNRAALDAGFKALGMPSADFSKLSRADALKVIADVDAKIAGLGAAPSKTVSHLADILHGGIRDLQASYIPEAWI